MASKTAALLLVCARVPCALPVESSSGVFRLSFVKITQCVWCSSGILGVGGAGCTVMATSCYTCCRLWHMSHAYYDGGFY
jgi:hypothetical protein